MTFTVDRAYLQPWAWFILPVSGAAAWWLHRRRAGGEETPFLPALAWIVSVFLALGWTIRLVRRLVD